MATDGVNITEDAEMEECEGDKVVTMMDVLQEQQDFEEDANAVLGASDDKNCTYAKGYIKRQAIYACLTCCPDIKADPTKRAGVCLACSLNCHENHELVELYTKRNFRCDCGNPKFNSHPCQFTPSKPDLNDDNIYNQNFSGLYCTCHRPYPDPESTIEDDMIQCIICEDWLHASHLETVVPANDQYSEMICKGCMDKNEFLHDYSDYAVNVESVDVDIVTVNGEKSADGICNGDVAKIVLTNGEAEDKSESEAIIPNGDKMDEDKESNDNKTAASEEAKTIDECIAPNDETKQSNESEIVDPTEGKSEVSAVTDENEKNTEQEAERQEKQESPEQIGEEVQKINEPIAAEQSSECMNIEEKNNEEIQKEDKLMPESEQNQNKEADEKMESADVEKTEVSGPQEQMEEHTPNETITHGDSADATKTEDQLLDDINTSSSSEQTAKETKDQDSAKEGSKTEENTDQDSAMEGSKIEENTDQDSAIEGSKIEENTECAEESVNKIEEQTNEKSASTEGNPDSEANTVEVPDTSQENKVDTENTDDKTDSVMDAIDELLKDPEASEPKINNEQSSEELPASKENPDSTEIQKPSDVEMSEDDKVPENNSTDVEIAESKNQEENASETKVDNMSTVESEISNDVETTENTSKIEPSADENKAQSDTPTDVDAISTETDKEINCDINSENKALNETENTNELKGDSTSKHDTSLNEKVPGPSDTTNENKRKLSIELAEETSTKKPKLNIDKCVRPRGVKKVYKGATFWASNFRQKLCTCGECLSMYKDLHVLFLTDIEDTVSAYESLGKENMDGGASQYEKGLQALSSLDRIQQINALTEYNKMRDKLLDFLKSFKDRKEIVKEEDIRAFFAGMKPRREPDGVYFCR